MSDDQPENRPESEIVADTEAKIAAAFEKVKIARQEKINLYRSRKTVEQPEKPYKDD